MEVDGVIAGHPKVYDVMCVGIPDEYRGETLKAFIVPETGSETNIRGGDRCLLQGEAGSLQGAKS